MPRGIPKNPTANVIGVLNKRRNALAANVAKCQTQLVKAQADLSAFDQTLKALVQGTPKAGTVKAKPKNGRRRGRPPTTATSTTMQRQPVNGRRRGRPPKAVQTETAPPPARRGRRPRHGGITQTDAIQEVLASAHRSRVSDVVNAVNSRYNLGIKSSSASTALSIMKRAGKVRNDKSGWYLLHRH